jgi:hypothetical protein
MRIARNAIMGAATAKPINAATRSNKRFIRHTTTLFNRLLRSPYHYFPCPTACGRGVRGR